MPLQNRVTPLGELIAHPAHGLVYGNRGCLHDKTGRIRRRYATKRWIACRLEFKGWHREPLQQPGKFTELFFLDEATAFAAGHRPCALCRREDYTRFGELWRELHPGQVGADAIDAQLHGERVRDAGIRPYGSDPTVRSGSGETGVRPHGSDPTAGQFRRYYEAPLAELPDGAFVLETGEPFLVLGERLLHWTPAGYDERRPRPQQGQAVLITPPSLVSVLSACWQPVVPLLDPSAT